MNEKSTFDRILNVLNDFKDDGEKISSKRRNTRFSRANFVKDDEEKIARLIDCVYSKFIVREILKGDSDWRGMVQKKYRPIVRQIAEHLGDNSVCFLNPKTLEVEDMPSEWYREGWHLSQDGKDGTYHEGNLETFDLHFHTWKNCIVIEPPKSDELYGMMAEFLGRVYDRKDYDYLSDALTGRKAFVRFSRAIQHATEQTREEWLEYRQNEMEGYVVRTYFPEFFNENS